MPEDTFMGPILTDEKDRKREFVGRKKDYIYKSISPKNVDEFLEDGWSEDRKLKKRLRLKKIKPFHERLENRFWCLLHKLGYTELNKGRQFTISLQRNGGEVSTKQIDVFAKDSETVVIAECKASEVIKKRSLQKDIEEFANIRNPIAKALRKHYGASFKPKILWLFVTENIIWSAPDISRAKGENIQVITEKELRYFNQISDHLGHAAKYQFLAEFFAGQKIPELQNRKIPAIRGNLGGKKFFTFVTTPRQLLKISFVNHRSLRDPEGVPTYQRLVQKGRLKAIGKFIDNGGFFPNNILINFDGKIRFEITAKDPDAGVHFGQLYFPDKFKSAWVIDGQHRLYGYSATDEKYLDQNIIVSAFEQLSHEEEARLFVTINHEQKSVQRNLLDDLKGELEWESTVPTKRIGAISSRLIGILNDDLGEPFYGRVSAQGIRSTDVSCLTIPYLMDGLRQSGLIGKAILKKKVYEQGPFSSNTDLKTLQRARAGLNQFFGLIKGAKPDRWDGGPGRYLCTNASIPAYFRLLASLILHVEKKDGIDSRELEVDDLLFALQPMLKPVFDAVRELDDDAFMQKFKVKYGSGGPKDYYFKLCQLVREKHEDFSPEGYIDWEAGQSEEEITLADKRIQEINSHSVSYIFSKFRDLYGEQGNAYWEKGVTNKEMKTKAYSKSLDYDVEDQASLENYLDFIDLKRIIEKKEHWPLFDSVFHIPEPGEKGIAKSIKWMDRINELRRVQAHKTKDRNYKPEDFTFVERIHTELMKRLSEHGYEC